MNAGTNVYLGGAERLGSMRLRARGKVRDIYAPDAERLAIVTTDRVSAFDVVMREGIPDKGRVLTSIAVHWFGRTRGVIANHLLSTDPAELPGVSEAERAALEGRLMIVRRAEVLPVEWVVRGYLAGSGWKEYRRAGTVCGIPLPEGLEFCGRLPEPLLTPTTKSDVHDAPLTPGEARELVGAESFDRARAVVLELFALGTRELEREGILLADTKFELGTAGGELLLVDEALTPDSSRFWPAESYATGRNQPSYDKQILRDWLETLDWDKEPPPPAIPDEIVARVAERYREVCEKVTGRAPVGVLP